jgi:hypothetical protein
MSHLNQTTGQTLLERAALYLSRNRARAGTVALAAVPLAAAAPARAGYLHKWTYAQAQYQSGSGTQASTLSDSDTPAGSTMTGTAHYALDGSAVALICDGYIGAGAGEVSGGDRADFTWDFAIAQPDVPQLAGLHWDLVAIYDTTSTPMVSQTLASGDGFGSFSGTGSLNFASDLTDMNWFGADLKITATAPASAAGPYPLDVTFSGDGISYAYVPEPATALGAVVMLSCLAGMRRRRGAYEAA